MAYSSSFAGVLVLVLISGGRWLAPSDAVSCMQAVEYLMPCQSFLMGFGSITTACCAGAQGLAKVTTSAADTKSACECLKQVAVWVNVNHDKAKQLPQLCNVKVPVPVQPDVNCDAIGSNAVLFRWNKNLESKAFRPTTPGNSPGVGHH